ncbi:MAG: NADP-dependent isocitrate dehydrogenase [Armatimonadaceae bacterium]
MNGQAKHRVTVIKGDGIGPEVVGAAQRIIEAAGVQIAWEVVEAGSSVFAQGIASGVPSETIESIRRNKIVLKGPLATPIGKGEKSANVTLRKLFETYANVRPARELPGVVTPFSGRGIDLTIVRENVEDLYAGIEHMQSPGVAQCLKLISHKGSEKVIRLAFAVARAEGRQRVTCVTKSNIMKQTEGMFQHVFEAVATEFPDIEADHMLVDNCAHQLVRKPESFGVIVTTNLNGDILSDLSSGLVGGLGFAPGANIGDEVAIFEAVHGTAPDIAGKGLANPKAMILSGVMMLRHLGELDAASTIENAVHLTLAEGKLTADAAPAGTPGLSTDAFTDAVIENLGRKSENSRTRPYRPMVMPSPLPRDPVAVRPQTRRTIGADIFLESGQFPDTLGRQLDEICTATALKLKMISNRGTRVYPDNGAMTDCVDHYRCRFVLREPADASEGACDADILDLMTRISKAGLLICQMERLQEFDGKPAYTKAQGED